MINWFEEAEKYRDDLIRDLQRADRDPIAALR